MASWVGASGRQIEAAVAIVAFSAGEVYAVAEMLRRFRGGAAVVMGALSPRTRNAQVAMYQAGEVDYIVATDAIGMGLNMDVHHVAFASLSKFDGRRSRRLHLSEMAQIAGRAGRHQQDGTFGTLHLGGGERSPEFTEEEVEAIGEHRFPPLDHLYWRNSDPDFGGVDELIEQLQVVAELEELTANPTGRAKGIVIEAQLDKGRGPVATVLVQRGTLHVGDSVVAGDASGRVRRMLDEFGGDVKAALPSRPVQVIGFTSVPGAGDTFLVVDEDRVARQIADRLVLSHRTVQNHVQNTLRKLQLHNRVELTRWAIEQGLDGEPDDPRA